VGFQAIDYDTTGNDQEHQIVKGNRRSERIIQSGSSGSKQVIQYEMDEKVIYLKATSQQVPHKQSRI
jgi:hypothetical protein